MKQERHEIAIAPLAEHHRERWRELYAGYASFYRRPFSADQFETLWSWLLNPHHPVEGIGAEIRGRLVGLAHFRAMPRPLTASDCGFLDDLFVDPQHRGSPAASLLLQKLRAIGQERGWPIIRWNTAETNYRARALYDRVGTKTPFLLYEMPTDTP